MGEFYAPRKQRQQEKRRANMEFSTKLLIERGVYFTTHNEGAHLIVAGNWDFYPSTGLFNERKGRPGKGKRTGRGVKSLLAIIEKDAAP